MAEKGFKRKLTAILSADAVGYSRLMGEDEAATVRTITSYRNVISTLIKQHNGTVIDSPGDNLLAEFVSVVDAVQCGVAVQKELEARNDELPENRRMQFRIGINLGDVIQEEDRIYGDGVNIAARLEALADPGGICVSKTAFDHIETKLPLGYEFMGDQAVKNIAKPVGAYRVMMEPRVTVAKEKEVAVVIPFWRRKAAIVGAIAVLVVIIGVAVWSLYLRPPPIEPASVEKMAYPLPEKPSVAVLPFVNMSDDPKQEYFSDGITEHIITSLSKVPYLFVIARHSTFSYKGKSATIQQIAEELGVRYVLEGSIQRSDDRVRITVQLIDATTGHHLWAENYDRKLDDIFSVQDEISKSIMVALQVKLTEGEMASLAADTVSIKAYQKYLKALEHYYRRTKEDALVARQLLQEAIALDPEYAAAYLLVGWTYLDDVWLGMTKTPSESIAKAEGMVQKTISIHGLTVGENALLSCVHLLKKDLDKAIAYAEKAVEQRPNYANVHNILGLALRSNGQYDEAISSFKKALQLDPVNRIARQSNLAWAYLYSKQYEKAISNWNETLERNPDYLYAYMGLTAAYWLTGSEDQAQQAAQHVLRINPKFSLGYWEKRSTSKDKALKEQISDAWRKAGLK
ncbi:MAG: tetratricopeptide repeat protein [Deltaproteobacteria bacterium]|nr:tetratricopeptide repeat protein [Deltaproteobacteria bacterium]